MSVTSFVFALSLYLTAVTSSPDPTPERDAVLQAGLTALLRAQDTPVQTPVVSANILYIPLFYIVDTCPNVLFQYPYFSHLNLLDTRKERQAPVTLIKQWKEREGRGRRRAL